MESEKTSAHVTLPDSQEHAATVDSSSAGLQGWRLAAVQFCLCFGLLLAVMEMSIVSTALITIAKDFDDYIKINWVVLAYLLTYTGFAVIFSRMSDVIGRKWAVVIALSIFTAFSLGCGLAQSLQQLIAFRALQGVGGSGIYAMTMVCLPEVTPRGKLAFISAGIGAVIAVSGVLGPILGGVITSHSTWRWVFLLNVPCGCVVLAAVLFCWRGPGRTLSKRVSWKQVDFFGAFLLLTATVLLIFALQEAGATAFSWGSVTIILTLVFAACCSIGFGVWIWFLSVRKIGVDPIFSPRILKKLVLAVVIVDTFLTGFSYIMILIQLPQRFQIVNQNTPELAGIHLLPLLIASAFTSFLGGAINSRKNFTFYTLIVANCLLLLGCGLLSSIPDTIEIKNAQYGYQVIYGLGVGMTLSTVTVMTTINANPPDIAVAQGAVAQARVFGGSVGLAIANIIFNSKVNAALSGKLTSAQLDELRRSLSSVATLPPAEQRAVVSVFAASFNTQMRVCMYVAAACLLVSFCAFQRHPPTMLDRKKAMEQMAARMRAQAQTEGGAA